MRNIYKKILASTLAFSIIFSQSVSVFANNEKQTNPLNITLQENKLTEIQAKNILDSIKDEKSLAKPLTDSNVKDTKVRVIVEVEGTPIIESATLKGMKVSDIVKSELDSQEYKLISKQNQVKNQMKSSGINSTIINSMTAILNGFTTEIKESEIESVKKISGVKNVYYSNEYERPQMTTSLDQVSARTTWDLGFKGEGTLLAVIDSGIDPYHRDFVMSEGVNLALTEDGVNKIIQSENLPGKYYNDKVVYAYNYYDLNDNVKDYGSSQHGQHVAGTMAANGNEADGGIKGVAPDAQLLGMKVFSSDMRYSTTFSDVYVKAIDDAIKLGATSINMSLGSSAGFHRDEGLEQKVLRRAQENGIVTTVSAGNDRNIVNGWTSKADTNNPDTGLIGSPSAFKASFTIASFENTSLKSASAKLIPDTNSFGDFQLVEANGAPSFSSLSNAEGYEYVFANIGRKEDFDAIQAEGKIVIVQRGNAFADTIKNGNDAKAKAVIVYNHQTGGEGLVNMSISSSQIPFAFVKRSVGLELVKVKQSNPNTKIIFNKYPKSFASSNSNEMSSFSSWGTTPDLQLKPELTAPGGNIYSTQNDNSYTTMSGTSMAAPHASGGVAVVKEFVDKNIKLGVFPELSNLEKSEFIQLLLMNTADVKSNPKMSSEIYSPRQQGAGLMNLYKATTNFVTVKDITSGSTSYGEGKLELGEVKTNTVTRQVELKNYSDKTITISPKVTVLQEGEINESLVQELIKKGYTRERVFSVFGKLDTFTESMFTLSTQSLSPITLEPKSRVEVSIPLDFSNLPNNRYAEGFVTFEKSDNQTLSLPFLGFKGEWDHLQIIDTFDATNLLSNPALSNNDNIDISATQKSQFKSSGFYQSGSSNGIIANPNKVVIAPKNTLYNSLIGISSAAPVISQLRNAKEINYKIFDKSGKNLALLNVENDVRKINNLYTGRRPFRLIPESKWDGTINGNYVQDGKYTYRITSIADIPNSDPQIKDFNFIVDNTQPEFTKDISGNLDYQYDKDTKILSFKAYDVIPEGLNVDEVSGLRSLIINNTYTNKIVTLLVDNLQLVDKAKNIYQINLDLTPYLQEGLNNIEISVNDNGWNTSAQKLTLGSDIVTIKKDVEPKVYLEKPNLLEIYGELGKTEFDIPLKGYVYGWDQIDEMKFDGRDVSFTKMDQIEINDAASGISYTGPGFQFETTIPFTQGYHEAKLTLKSQAYNDFGIARRFWVDLTKPTLVGEKVFNTDTTSKELSFNVIENLFFLNVTRDGSVVLNKDVSSEFGFGANINTTVTDTVSNLKDGINILKYKLSDTLYTTEQDVYVVKGTLNIRALISAIDEAKAINGAYYQPSLDNLINSVTEAENLIASGNPTQEEVNLAEQKIRNAISALTAPASSELKSQLQELVDKAEKINKDILDDESLEKLNLALTSSKEVLANSSSTDYDVYTEIINIKNVLDTLTYKDIAPKISSNNANVFVGDTLDKTTLFNAIDKFGQPVEVTISGDLDTNTVGKYELTASAIADGLETKTTAIINVLENDKTELNSIINNASSLDLTKYSTESKNVLISALENAKNVKENVNATKEQIQKALNDLNQAISNLKLLSTSILNIVPTIKAVNQEIGVGSVFNLRDLFIAKSPSGENLVVNITNTANLNEVGVYEINGEVEYKGAKAKTTAILTVVENSKSTIIDSINFAEQLSTGKYTESSLENLNQRLNEAKIVRTNINASMLEIINASRNLLNAINALETLNVLNGWVSVDNNQKYYVNNVALTGKQTIGNTTYLFDKDGNKQYGWHILNNKKYYFSPDHNGGMITGIRTIGQTTYLFHSEGYVIDGWARIDGKDYYFSPEHGGGMLTGIRKVGATTYLFNSKGYKEFGWHRLNNKDYYFAPEFGGGMVTGVRTIGSATYYFNTTQGYKEYRIN